MGTSALHPERYQANQHTQHPYNHYQPSRSPSPSPYKPNQYIYHPYQSGSSLSPYQQETRQTQYGYDQGQQQRSRSPSPNPSSSPPPKRSASSSPSPPHSSTSSISKPTSPKPTSPRPTSPQPTTSQPSTSADDSSDSQPILIRFTKEQQDEFNRRYRQVVRRTTRNSLGIATSGAMSTVFPYMLGPMAASGYGLYKARKARREDIARLEKLGFQIRKRDLANGMAVGALQKLPFTFLLWGHDEVLFSLGSLVEHYPDSEGLFEGALGILDLHGEALDIPVVEDANGLAEYPVDAIHDILGIDGAEERIDDAVAGQADTGGWHDSGAHVAEDVLLVAPVAAAVDRIADAPFEWYDRRQTERLPGDPGTEQIPPPLPPRPKRD